MQYKNRRLSVSIGKTISLGNYESMKIHCGVSVDIADDTDVDDAYNDLFEEVTGQVLAYEDESINGEK